MQTDELETIQDFVRWGASRFGSAGLYFGHGTDNATDEASWLIAHALHLPVPLPASFGPCRLTRTERSAVVELLERRINERRPAAYLTGRAWFAGLEFLVDERVMVPRSPLGALIEDQFAPWIDPDRIEHVLDMCTGSGCLGLAVALHLPEASVDLVDLSPAALQVAQANLDLLAERGDGLTERVRLLESDLFANLGDVTYDLIIANPPYVGAVEMERLPPEYHYEPRAALAAGESGLDLVLHLLRDAPDYLSEDGMLIVEVGNTAAALEARLPRVAFTWIEFERGGHGVFLLRQDELLAHHALFAEAVTAP